MLREWSVKKIGQFLQPLFFHIQMLCFSYGKPMPSCGQDYIVLRISRVIPSFLSNINKLVLEVESVKDRMFFCYFKDS